MCRENLTWHRFLCCLKCHLFVHHVVTLPIFLSSLFCLLFVRVFFTFLGWSLSIFACFLHCAYKTGQALLFSGPSVKLSPMGMLRFNQPINHVASPKARSGAWVWEAASYNRSSDFFSVHALLHRLIDWLSLRVLFSKHNVFILSRLSSRCFLVSSF